jgi:hypothetical protein
LLLTENQRFLHLAENVGQNIFRLFANIFEFLSFALSWMLAKSRFEALCPSMRQI